MATETARSRYQILKRIRDGSGLDNDVIDSQHYAAGSIDNEHMAANSIDSDEYVDGSIDNAHLAANSVDSDNYVDGSIDLEHIAAASLDGTIAKVVADNAVIGGIPVLHQINVPTDCCVGDIDVTLTHKTRVIDAWFVLEEAGIMSGTLQVKNGATAITDAMDASGSDTAVVRAATINDAAQEIAASGTLRVTSAGGASQGAATVYVLGVRVA